MLLSGKITNSYLIALDRQGVDLEKIFELTDLPTEFLRDPSCWIPAVDVEKFLQGLDREFGALVTEALPTFVGHQCHNLRAWGVLDSVIKMMSQPQDLFLQPHRFLSYFVSPAPVVGNIMREAESVIFDLPLTSSEYPHVTEFLRSALEVLPCYLGRNQAQAKWSQTRIQISWSESQSDLLTDEDLQPNYKPELVQGLMQALEESQSQIEDLRQQLSLAESNVPQPIPSTDTEFVQGLRASLVRVRGHMMRLSDYLVRSQQLVTLLIGQDRMNRQVQEAMRRVDWEYVKAQSTQVAQDTADLLTEFERDLNRRLKPGLKKKSSQGRLEIDLEARPH